MTVHILVTPMKELKREDAGVRWCFKDRAHLPHEHVLKATVEPSYYDPDWSLECSRCGEDNTYFPGTGPL